MPTTLTAARPVAPAAPTPTRRRRARRTLGAVAVLIAVYAALAALHSPRGYLVSDVGGRVATVRSLARHPGDGPDLGYWAERFDPAGRLMPFGNAVRTPRAWVTAGSLVTIYAGYPLWELGGYRAMLALPVAGAVLAALAARRLARLLAPDDTGWLAFWLVGLASPVLVDGLDFWDHTLGLALLAWAAVLALEGSRRGETSGRRDLAVGLLVGAAATLRTEALVYGAVLVLALLVVEWRRSHRVAATVRAAARLGVATLVPLVANDIFERFVLGGSLRAGRTAGYGGSGLLLRQRLTNALVTAVGLRANESTVALSLGIALTVALVAVAAARTRDRRTVLLGLALGTVLYGSRFAAGLGFVPGLVATTPLVVFAVVGGWADRRLRPLILAALLALPLVWLSQFPGGELPVWGPRYLLPTGLVLGVVGTLVLRSKPRFVALAAIGLSVIVTAYGVAWMVQRSRNMARTGDAVVRLRDDVVVSRQLQLFTELGAFWHGQHWLRAKSRADLVHAATIGSRTGARTLAVIEMPDQHAGPLPGYCSTGRHPLPQSGTPAQLFVGSYVRAGSTGCAVAP